MKFLHTADLHLGRLYKEKHFKYAAQRREELWTALSNLIGYAGANDVAFILIAGDLYEADVFSAQDMERLLMLFSKFKGEIVLIGGNHDPVDSASLYRKFKLPDNVHLLEDNVFEIDDVRIYGISWNVAYDFAHDLDFDLDKNYKNIALLHGDVRDEHHFKLDVAALTDFDYVALGHIHKPHQVAPTMYYAGALAPLKFKDEGAHGFYVVDTDAMVPEFIESAKRRYVELSVDVTGLSLDTLRQKVETIVEAHNEDFLRIVFEGSSPYTDLEHLFDYPAYYLEFKNHTRPELDDDILSDPLFVKLHTLVKGESFLVAARALLETAHDY
ncbi:metallophosphoesterase [Peptoniphilus equinus]|uniref:Metallophosphoesterase n=1 Tax=Peptoniphilus equinus TaxID=3016343 RepID=A0ABY7QSF5_9FIRM|nr:metallophosphoesterase [Peptoniphilus equinus]WBW49677.1 metallophosphoesterase [Peptoniphilus equinus]